MENERLKVKKPKRSKPTGQGELMQSGADMENYYYRCTIPLISEKEKRKKEVAEIASHLDENDWNKSSPNYTLDLQRKFASGTTKNGQTTTAVVKIRPKGGRHEG